MNLEGMKHYIGGGVYAKEWRATFTGETVEQHSHNYDHLSYLASGSVEVTVDGKVQKYSAPTALLIKAHKQHTITALTRDVVWLCLHKIPDEVNPSDADRIEEHLVDGVL